MSLSSNERGEALARDLRQSAAPAPPPLAGAFALLQMQTVHSAPHAGTVPNSIEPHSAKQNETRTDATGRQRCENKPIAIVNRNVLARLACSFGLGG